MSFGGRLSTVRTVTGRPSNGRSSGPCRRLGLVAPSAIARAVAEEAERHGFDVCARATSVDRFAWDEGRGPLDVCLVGSTSFGDDESRGLRRLAAQSGGIPLVVVAGTAGRAIRDAVSAGASGFVALDSVATQLAPTVEAVCAGQLTVPIQFRQALVKPVLSPREKQIMAMVVMGFSNREIANRLYLAETTIKSHLSSAFVKLGVRSRHEATSLILDSSNGLGTGILAISEDLERLAPVAG